MPSLQEVSFAITQGFNCPKCHNDWSSTVKVPQAGYNCREHTTIEMILQKSLHASGSVLYGNIGIRDIQQTEDNRQLMEKKLRDCQGVIELECKPNYSNMRTCADCMYKSNRCESSCFTDQDSPSFDPRLTVILRSLDSDCADGETQRSGEIQRSVELQHSLSNPEPLDENQNTPQQATDYSITKILAETSQVSPKSSIPPTPAPRRSLTTRSPSTEDFPKKFPDQISRSTDCTSVCTDSTSFSDYEHPVPQQPPLPPKEENIFHYSIKADEIRDAMRMTGVRDSYAVVELEVKNGDGAKMRSPYLIISTNLTDGYKVVLQTQDGLLFIHEHRTFKTLRDLLNYYKKHRTGCGALLANQLTKSQLQNYRRSSARRPLHNGAM